MYQAIVTKYHGPTNRQGSRYSATAQAGRVYVHKDDALNSDGNHELAMRKFAEKFRWCGNWRPGYLPDGSCVWTRDSLSGQNPGITLNFGDE
jgi:hypothetical protein